jgi:hypothetical protein
MMYEYRYSDNVTQQPVIVTLDPTAPREKAALDYVVRVIGATSYTVVPRIAVYQNLPDTVGGVPGAVVSREATVRFAVPGATDRDDLTRDGLIETDLRLAVQSPRAAVLGLVIAGNLAIAEIPPFGDDAPKPAVQDWQVSGARIGPPLASGGPGWFVHRGDGGSVGDRWTGASGRVYELAWMGAFAFFRVMAWRAA